MQWRPGNLASIHYKSQYCVLLFILLKENKYYGMLFNLCLFDRDYRSILVKQ